MEEKLPCDKNTEKIRTLFSKHEATNKRIDGMENKIEDITDIKLAINTISMSMEHMVESDKKRDLLDEKRDQMNEMQNKTLENINQNLNELNKGQQKLNNKVDSLEQRVDDNESKHSIDLRDIEKKKYTDIFFKYIIPTGGGLIILMEVLKLLQR